MKTLVLLTLAVLLVAASAYELALISGNNQKSYAGSDTIKDTKLNPIVLQVKEAGAPVQTINVYYRQLAHLSRSKLFCVDPNDPSKTFMTSDREGFVRCYPKLGFGPGVANITFSTEPNGPGPVISITIEPIVHVMGWIQIGLVFLITIAAIIFAIILAIVIMVQPTGTEKMKAVANAIRDGANGFMKTQYLAIAILSVPVAVIVFILYGVLRDESPSDPKLGSPFVTAVIVAVSFMLGVICSGLAGFVGMWVSVRANLRVAAAAASKSGAYNKAVRVAMLAGAFAGFLVVSLSVLGVCTLFTILYLSIPSERIDPHQIVGLIVGYGFGASFCALFAQLGGGIFTKAADVGADLCGKVVAGLPEDDLRNPAVIADLVGDNVGDCAGRGADLFESIAAENIGAMIIAGTLAAEAAPQITTPLGYIIFPLIVHCFGMLATTVALLFVQVRDKRAPGEFDEQDNQVTKPLLGTAEESTIQTQASPEVKEKRQQLTNPMWALGLGMVVASIIALGLFILACWWCLYTPEFPNAWWMFLLCGIAGIVTAFVFCLITIFYTDYNFPPVRSIIQSSKSGPATNVIAGIAVGLESTAAPVLVISLVIVASYYAGRASGIKDATGKAIGGLFGTAVATMGMLSTATYILAMDVFGPITDNAGGIVEMSKQPESVRVITDTLDAAGNTTKALTKGYAIGSAALASFLLFSAFMDTISAFSGVPFTTVNLAVPETFVGALLGAMLVFLFSSLAIRAVGNAAETVIREVQRQFETIEGIRDYDGTEGSKGRPDYDKCVQIVTRAGLVQMILPGLLAVAMPTILGFVFRLVGYLNGDRFMGPSVVAGFLMVATITGILMALFLNNAGGAWDNSKKAIELISDEGKGSSTHKAAVIGDTVGDPFKDTAGPSIHVLIKLLATVTLVLGPMFLNKQ